MSLVNLRQHSNCIETFEILPNEDERNNRAFDLIQFVDKISLQIESFACYDDWFILGTSCGRILFNQVRLINQKYESNVEKLIYKTKKPIQQLEVVKRLEILIALFDSQIHVFNLRKFQLEYSIAKTRGCSMFAVSFSDDLSLLNLCVARKKNLQFYYTSNNHNAQFKELINDLELNEAPKNLKLTKENLIIFSLRKEYFFYSLPKKSTEINKSLVIKQVDLRASRNYEPLCEKLDNDYFTLNIEDNKTLVYDGKGKPDLAHPVLWSNVPVSICALGPYLIGLLNNFNIVEIMLIEPINTRIQTVQFTMTTNDKLKLVRSNGSNVCYLVSAMNVWCLMPVDVNKQLEQCLISKNYSIGVDLILSHLNYLEDKSKWRSKVNENCSSEDEKKNAFSSVNALNSELKSDLVNRVNKLNALSLYSNGKYDESLEQLCRINVDPSHVIGLVPGILPDKYKHLLKFDDYFPSLDGEEFEKLIDSLTNYIQFKRNEILSLKADDLKFLPLIDGRPVSKTKETILEIIDTSLVKAYLIIKKSLVPIIVRREPSFFNLNECEKLLEVNKMYECLVSLYEKKNLHEKALGVLMRESTSSSTVVGYLRKNGPGHFQLILKYARKVFEEDANFAMQIFTKYPIDTINKLIEKRIKPSENLEMKCIELRKDLKRKKSFYSFNSNQTALKNLILSSCTNNIDKIDHNAGTNVIVEEVDLYEESDEAPFDHQIICGFLKKKIKPANLSQRLLRVYLEYLILLRHEINTDLNNDLIDAYLQETAGNEENIRMRFLYFLSETNEYSTMYALSKLDVTKYPEERATVLGKEKRHFEALNIYVNFVGDIEKAEAYCDRVFTSEAKIYDTLLQIYLSSEYEEIRLAASITLLNRHSDKIGSCRTLHSLPGDLMKFKHLTPFLENMMIQLTRNKCSAKVVNKLMFALEFQAHADKIFSLGEHFRLNEEDVCKICLKRIGKCAIVRFPNNHVIHYGCSKFSDAFMRLN